MTLAELRAHMVATLVDAGVRATDDPRTVNPPCVLVDLAEGTRMTGCAFQGTIPVSVISTGAGHAAAAAWLDDTASTVAGLLGATIWATGTYDLPDGSGGLLEYTLTVPAVWEVPT